MKRSVFVCALLLSAAAFAGGQQASPANPYEGVSNPPPDDTITTPAPQSAPQPPPKPSPAHRVVTPAQTQSSEPEQTGPPMNYAPQGNDDGIVQVAPGEPAQPSLNQRAYASDPDGDIVHPEALPAGELGPGVTIRARLLERLSTAFNERGDTFRTRVASDVLQNGQVLIPTGAEIDGTVVEISTGHTGGHGSMRLRPDTVILPDGSRFRLYAEVTGAPGSRDRVSDEGAITPGSRMKKDSIEYGGAAGTGAVAGAVLGGPVGALAGTLVGAGAVTVHLLLDHPQATLNSGTVLLFTLTESLNLVPAGQGGI